jgi:hypothetical protein
MNETESADSTLQMSKHRSTKTFDRLLLAYFMGIIFVSFYALFSHH